MSHDLETEFRLRAGAPLEVASIDAVIRDAGFACRGIAQRRHADTYLDDAAGTLARAGIGLRIRDDQVDRRATSKARGHRGDGLFVRAEIDAPWPDTTTPRTARDLPPGLRDAVEPFVLDRPLTEVLRLVTQRDTRTLLDDGRDLCTVMIDRVEASGAGRTATFEEVEVEVLNDVPSCEHLVQTLGKHLPLQLAGDDKPTHAAALLGLQRAAPLHPGMHATVPTGSAVLAIADRHLTVLRHAEVAVRTDADPTALHTMRVAVRRLRCLVRAFRGVWPNDAGAWMLDHLSRTGRQLGSLRDLDVMLAALPAGIAALPQGLHPAGASIVRWVTAQRSVTSEQVQTWLRSPARLADARRLAELLGSVDGEGPLAAEPLAATAPRRVEKAMASLRKLADGLPSDLPFEPTHAVRIACKRLRYLAEELAPLQARSFGKSLRAISRLQADLGVVCDHEVAARRLLTWVPEATAASNGDAMVAAALGGLATDQMRAAHAARQRTQTSLDRARRKKVWRRFRRPAIHATLAP